MSLGVAVERGGRTAQKQSSRAILSWTGLRFVVLIFANCRILKDLRVDDADGDSSRYGQQIVRVDAFRQPGRACRQRSECLGRHRLGQGRRALSSSKTGLSISGPLPIPIPHTFKLVSLTTNGDLDFFVFTTEVELLELLELLE